MPLTYIWKQFEILQIHTNIHIYYIFYVLGERGDANLLATRCRQNCAWWREIGKEKQGLMAENMLRKYKYFAKQASLSVVIKVDSDIESSFCSFLIAF